MTRTPPPSTTISAVLLEQIEFHWREQARPHLEGLTDEEYLFDPTADGSAWTLHPRRDDLPQEHLQGGSGDLVIDFVFPEPSPQPFTTIAWRLGHVIVGVLALRNHSHFGGPAADYMTWDYASTAAGALAQLDREYERWIEGVRAWSEDDLLERAGEAEGPWADLTRADLVAHIHRELIHHLAEIALLRDLWTHTR